MSRIIICALSRASAGAYCRPFSIRVGERTPTYVCFLALMPHRVNHFFPAASSLKNPASRKLNCSDAHAVKDAFRAWDFQVSSITIVKCRLCLRFVLPCRLPACLDLTQCTSCGLEPSLSLRGPATPAPRLPRRKGSIPPDGGTFCCLPSLFPLQIGEWLFKQGLHT